MADGYISQIKTPDNKVYLLKDSEKTDEKVKQSSNAEDKEFPIILKNTNNTTNETNGVKYAGGVTVNPSEKTVTATEFIGNIRIDRLKPIITKTYTAPLYNATSGANFFQTFATVNPVDYNAIWIVSYRITITASGHSDYTEICDVSISGRANTYYTYKVYNSLVNYSIYQHVYLRSNAAATPHELGYRMQGSYGADTVQKVVKVELLEQNNCTVTLLDSLKMYANATPSGYAGWTQITATSNGLQESGDVNDTGYYILSNGFKGKAGSNKVYRYCLFARTGDGTYESFVMQDNTVATTKTANSHGFVPDGKIYWNSNNTVYSEGTLNLSAYEQYHVIDYRYSFNFNNTFLPDYCETYVVYTYNEDDGLLYLDTTQWLAAALPTTADGKIYQRIGSKYYTGTSNYYQGSLLLDNPYYEFKNGKIRTWAPSTRGIKSITRSGTTFTATRDDGSTFTFTQQDTNKYHKSGSWSGLTYTATAVNSADELKFTIPNKIQTNWELNATSGNSPALLFTRDSSLTDWKVFVTSGQLSFQSATDGSTWTERAYFKDNSGDFVATSFTGNGSALTSLNASNLASGTVPVARLPLATANAAGAVKIGSGISVSDGTISVTAGNLGLSSALRYQGTTTTAMSDGLTTAKVKINNADFIPSAGDVVIYNDAEYLWTGSLWELIGAESSFKKVQTAVSSSSATGSSATTFVSSVTQDTQGVITVKTSTLNTSGTWSGNAGTATKLSANASNTTASFWRGDNTWSSTLTGSITISKAGECGLEVINSQATNPHKGFFGGGSSGNLGIYDRTYNKWIVYSDPSGNAVLNGNANTATSAGKWTTARTLTIGSTGKSVDGSGNVSWSLAEIGAAASGHNHSGTYVPNTGGANDINTIVNTGIYNITSGSATNGPKGYGFGQLLVMSYRKHTGNTTTDWASQIYLHNGSGTASGNATAPGNVLYYRTSNNSTSNTWFDWQKAIHADAAYTKIGDTNKPVYITEDGTATAISYTIAKSVPSDAKFTDTNTTYTFAEGSTNGAFSVTPSGGSAQSVSIHGLGTAAYKAVGDFAAASHSHSYLANTNTGAADRPIYITGNAAAQTTYRMAGTNVTATTALAITNDLDTGIWYVNGTSGILSQSDGAAYVNKYSNSWLHEIYGDYRTGHIAVRGKNNGTWKDWLKVLDSGNYTDYTVTKTGTGASGTWGINITGSAGSVAWANTGHPSTFPPESHTHGNLSNDGKITTAITIAANDYIIIGDNSDGGKIGKGPIFDASTETQCLTKKGTWKTFGTSNLAIGTTSSTAMAGNTVVTNVAISANTVTNADYPIVFATSNTATTAAKNEGLQKSGTKFFANPSTGTLYSTKFCVDESVTLQYNDTDKSLDFIFT